MCSMRALSSCLIPRQAGLQPTLVGEPWERVSVDITGPHPRSARQNQYIRVRVIFPSELKTFP